MVLFPDPVYPTKPTDLPAGTVKETLSMTVRLSLFSSLES